MVKPLVDCNGSPLRSQVLPKPEDASEHSARRLTEHEGGPHQVEPGHSSGTHGGSHSLRGSKCDAIRVG